MAKVIILGTANSIPDQDHENTHLAVQAENHTILIDCVGNPVARLRRAGIEPNSLTDLILTHIHPDHIYGVPILLMDMWLMGRRDKLVVHGLEYTLERVRGMMELYEWGLWPNFFPIDFHTLASEPMVPVIEEPGLNVFSSPVKHLVPTIGLRFEFPKIGKSLAYSCDTEPAPEVIRLAASADILIHEATGASRGHTSAAQAGEIARQAGAKCLYLIHYPPDRSDLGRLVAEARTQFSGAVDLTEDFLAIELG